jgi:iron complex transport system substrate-binding protein
MTASRRAFSLLIRGIALPTLCACAFLLSARAAVGAPPQQRIVSLAPSITETLFALGVGAQVVGVSQYSDYPEAARRLPQVGTYLTPNVEAIVGLHPTLIIGLVSSANLRAMRAFAGMGYSTVTVGEGTLADIQESITRIGHAVGRDDRAAELITDMHRHFATVEQRLKRADSPKVLMLVGHQPMVAVGSSTFLNELIAMAHGDNIAANSGDAWPRLSIEYIIATAPAVIIDGQMGSDATSPSNFWQHYPTIPAVKHQRLYGYSDDPVLRPGPRVWESLEVLAQMIHPELMSTSAPGPSRWRGPSPRSPLRPWPEPARAFAR